ncbi:MAG: DUF899 domain-containing protein [Beggiatoa sp.]|nr:DUF899 domain-containing protein [Beggiatoa sp.]
MQEFPSEEAPGISVFYKDTGGDVFHTYSTYGRGTPSAAGCHGRDREGLRLRRSQW